jgi:hypothetical protein
MKHGGKTVRVPHKPWPRLAVIDHFDRSRASVQGEESFSMRCDQNILRNNVNGRRWRGIREETEQEESCTALKRFPLKHVMRAAAEKDFKFHST